jgi:Arrestin (or S-antigen), C-terminal domain
LITVLIDRPWKFDLTYKVAFTVLKQLDLNYENPALKIPTKMELVNTFYCGFCKTDPLYLAASIPMSGYVAGQHINISIEINNESRIDVEDLKIALKKIIHYNSQTPSLRTKEEVLTEAEIRCGGVLKRSKGKFDQKLLIPPCPPSNQNYCKVLNVSYELQVTAKIAGVHRNPVLKLPITIGTVPLNLPMSQNQQFAIHYPTAPNASPSISPTNQFMTTEANNQQQNIQYGELGK